MHPPLLFIDIRTQLMKKENNDTISRDFPLKNIDIDLQSKNIPNVNSSSDCIKISAEYYHFFFVNYFTLANQVYFIMIIFINILFLLFWDNKHQDL
jgi:hypothetical protein